MPAKKENALTALQVKNLKVPGQYSSGKWLTLLVEQSGAKRWFQRVTIGGKQRNTGLGGYPAVSLAAAREAAAANLRAIKTDGDIIGERKRARAAAKAPVSVTPTFAEAAAEYIGFRRDTWSNAKHAAQWRSTLATYAGPVIGDMPVDQITRAHVMQVLAPIWTRKHETASRVRQRMESIFDWTIDHGHRSDNPAEKRILKSLAKVRKTNSHHRALPYSEVPAALERVRRSGANPVTKMAFEFLALTAARSGEARLALWEEIDWDTATWTIPAERMKARRRHRVPLSSGALRVLRQARSLHGGEEEGLIFPARAGGPALSDMAFTEMLRRLEIGAVPHGFRRSFKTWASETKAGTRYETEAALAHNVGDGETEAAYIDTEFLEPRRPLMEQWAEFLRPSAA